MTVIPRSSKPRLTALITNYNYGRYLAAAVHGIATQSRPPDELIVVDDASTDGSERVIEGLVRQYPFIKVVNHAVNRGMNAAGQEVLDVMTGDYLYWGSADDMVLPGFFEGAMSLIERYPEAPVCSGVAVWFREESGEQYATCTRMPSEDGFLSAERVRDLARRRCLELRGHTSIYRVHDLRRLGGFPVETKWHSDWFILHTLGLSRGMCWSARPHAVMRTHGGNYARGAAQRHDEQREVLRCIAKRIVLDPDPEVKTGFRTSGVLAEHQVQMLSLLMRQPDLWPLWSFAFFRNSMRATVNGAFLRAAAAVVPDRLRGRIGRMFRRSTRWDLSIMKGRSAF